MAAVHRVSGSARRVPRHAILRSVALVAIALLGGVGPGAGRVAAAGLLSPKAADPLAATTSRAARDSAVQAIPVEKLDPASRAKVASVLSDISLFRRMPVSVVDCDPDLYLFMVQHPDVVVNIWEVLDLSRMKLQQTGPEAYRVTDSAGMVADMVYLYRSHDLHVVYAEGTYEGPLAVRPVKGSCLMVLKTGYIRETNGRYYITSRLDSFCRSSRAGSRFWPRRSARWSARWPTTTSYRPPPSSAVSRERPR